MSKQEMDPIVYRVGIVRQDMGFDPLYTYEDMDRELAVRKLKELVNEWQESAEKASVPPS